MFTFHHGHLASRSATTIKSIRLRRHRCGGAAPGRCCEHGRVRSSIIMMRGHSTTRDYTCATSSCLFYISNKSSHRTSLFIITRVAPRARNVLLVLLMHIDNIESIVDSINGTSSFTHCRRSSSYQQQVIVDHEQQGIRASSSTRARAVVRCARCLFVLAYVVVRVRVCVILRMYYLHEYVARRA